jgi:predicted membrane-bound spermidine synthase
MLRKILEAGGLNKVYLMPVAEIMLVILLVQCIGIAGVLILLPLARFSWQGLRTPGRWAFLGYFAALGLGFIMIEIVLLQRFTLFLGQPIYTFAVVLASLLIFTGAGSYVANLFRGKPQRVLFWMLLAILFAIGATLLFTPWVLSAALGFALPWRVGIAVALVAPLGILLGMPFPTGLRIVAYEASPLVPWAWGVNGFFTVIGSVSSMILGMTLGFTAVLVIAGMCYLVALVAIAACKSQQQLLVN